MRKTVFVVLLALLLLGSAGMARASPPIPSPYPLSAWNCFHRASSGGEITWTICPLHPWRDTAVITRSDGTLHSMRLRRYYTARGELIVDFSLSLDFRTALVFIASNENAVVIMFSATGQPMRLNPVNGKLTVPSKTCLPGLLARDERR